MKDELYRDIVAVTAKDGLDKYKFVPTLTDEGIRKRLSEARRNGHLTLVLGAGISLPSGLDSWEVLVARAATKLFAGTSISKMPDILKASNKSSIAKIRFCESTTELKTGFRVFLTEALYENYESKKTNTNINSLCNLILGLDGKPQVREVVTYNFDNLLELALQKEKKKASLDLNIVSVISAETYQRTNDPNSIRIYHPHGFLPHGRSFRSTSKLPIVFSETDYHKHFQDVSYWANSFQLDRFSQSTCLFVGISFECPNMRRLLDYVQLQGGGAHAHAALMRIKPAHDRNLENFLIAKDLESFGVSPVWIASYGDVPAFLASI
jgi:NAD-dependent SIR2 family protein deacetylase